MFVLIRLLLSRKNSILNVENSLKALSRLIKYNFLISTDFFKKSVESKNNYRRVSLESPFL